MEALKSGKEIEKVLIQTGLRGEGFLQLHALMREMEIPVQFVPLEKLNRMSRQNHQGVIAMISEITYQKIESILPFVYEQGKVPLVLVLDHITDVRNLGAVARTAECSAVDAILLPEKGSAQVNQDAIKTSAGALYKVPVCRYHSIKEIDHISEEQRIEDYCSHRESRFLLYRRGYDTPLSPHSGIRGKRNFRGTS